MSPGRGSRRGFRGSGEVPVGFQLGLLPARQSPLFVNPRFGFGANARRFGARTSIFREFWWANFPLGDRAGFEFPGTGFKFTARGKISFQTPPRGFRPSPRGNHLPRPRFRAICPGLGPIRRENARERAFATPRPTRSARFVARRWGVTISGPVVARDSSAPRVWKRKRWQYRPPC